MKKDSRPTSPHLQVYAWNISSVTSIMHRLTGLALYVCIVAISWYVVLFTYKISGGVDVAAAEKCDCAFMEAMRYVACAAGVAMIFALFYHFCNGIRHLFFDIGKGFELKTAKITGYLVFITAILLTALTLGMIVFFKFM